MVSKKWSHFMICCFLCTTEAVERFTGNRRSYEALNVTENKTRESLEWEVWEFGNESFMRAWSNGRNEGEKREWEKINEFAQIPSSLAILYSRKLLEITIRRSSRVQKYN